MPQKQHLKCLVLFKINFASFLLLNFHGWYFRMWGSSWLVALDYGNMMLLLL